MDKLEKVEKVREKTGASYEDARDALEACGYDVLDAIVLLERRGMAQRQAAHHATFSAEPAMSYEMVQAQQAYEASSKKTKFGEVFERIMDGLKRLCSRGLEVSFVVEREGSRLFAMPSLILVLLAVFLLPATVPLLIVGLFFGFRYRFEGIGTMSVDVNDMMDKAADGAERLKHDVMNET